MLIAKQDPYISKAVSQLHSFFFFFHFLHPVAATPPACDLSAPHGQAADLPTWSHPIRQDSGSGESLISSSPCNSSLPSELSVTCSDINNLVHHFSSSWDILHVTFWTRILKERRNIEPTNTCIFSSFISQHPHLSPFLTPLPHIHYAPGHSPLAIPYMSYNSRLWAFVSPLPRMPMYHPVSFSWSFKTQVQPHSLQVIPDSPGWWVALPLCFPVYLNHSSHCHVL